MGIKILLAVLGGMAVSFRFDFPTSNILTAFIALAVFMLLNYSFSEEEKNEKIAAVSMAVFCTFSVVMSFEAEWFAKNENGLVLKWLGFFVMIVGFYFLFRNLFRLIIEKLNNLYIAQNNEKRLSERTVFFVALLVMYVVWLLFFFKDYPGNMTTDSSRQLSQALGLSGYSDHHPVIHTLFIKWLVNAGKAVFGSLNGGIAFYTCVQMLCLALSFAYLVSTMYKFAINKIIIYITVVFYTITPYHCVYSHTMWKDVWFGAIVACFCTTLWRIVRSNGKYKVFDMVQFFVMGLGLCLFRSNGLYVYILMLPFLIFYFIRKNIAKKQMITICISVLLLALIIKIPVYKAMDVTPPDTIESLSIPAQQIARVVTNKKDISHNDEAVIDAIVPSQLIPGSYNPAISDGIKNLVRDKGNQDYIKNNKWEVIGTYFSIGFKHPVEYLNAFIDQTKGYWYPNYQYWVYPAEFISPNGEVSQKSLYNDSVKKFIDGYNNLYKKIPILGLFWSIGTFVWIMIFMAFMTFIKKKYSYLLVYFPIIGIWATLLVATPVFCEFRYLYALFTVMPLLIYLPFDKDCLDSINK